MAKHASWIHGTAVHAHRDGYFIVKTKSVWGAAFKTHGEEWFSFPIPTPVIVGGQRSKLKKVFVFYQTLRTARITHIDLYDGFEKFESFPGLVWDGDHHQEEDDRNALACQTNRDMRFGLNVAVHVVFGPASSVGVPEIRFTTAGADFETP